MREPSGPGKDEALRRYVEQVEARTPLSPEAQFALARTVAAGKDAQDALVKANLGLVVAIATRFSNPRLHTLDLVQEGNVGLMHAVEKFDPRKGFDFSTYATWWIRQAITRQIADSQGPR